jgi:chromosome segregation ATPase
MGERHWPWAIPAEASGIASVFLFAVGGRQGRPWAVATLIGALLLLLGWLRQHSRQRPGSARSPKNLWPRLTLPTGRSRALRARLEAELTERTEKLEQLRRELEKTRQANHTNTSRLEQELAQLRASCATHRQVLAQERRCHTRTLTRLDEHLGRHQYELTQLEHALQQRDHSQTEQRPPPTLDAPAEEVTVRCDERGPGESSPATADSGP